MMHATRFALPASAILLSLNALTSAAIIGRDEVDTRSSKDSVIPDFVADLFKSDSEEVLRKRQQIGATCYEDAILSSMQAEPIFTEFCSGWLDLPASTTTTTTTAIVYVIRSTTPNSIKVLLLTDL